MIGSLTCPHETDIDSVNLDAEEWSSDINNVTSVLKLWLRELPDPLLTQALHQGFIEAASTYHSYLDTLSCASRSHLTISEIENDRLRHIRLHERVNELPDPNYATLKFFMGHLYK